MMRSLFYGPIGSIKVGLLSQAREPRGNFRSGKHRVGFWIWPPLLSIYLLFFTASLAQEFEWLPESLKELAETGFRGRALFAMTAAFFIGSLPSSSMHTQGADKEPGKLNRFRIFLSFFFFLYAYVVAQGMIPLPDEPPRINFRGVFCATAGLVIAYHCLVSRYRLFLVSVWLFIPMVAFAQMEKRIKFLEMMLEPMAIEKAAYYGIGLVYVVLLSPKALQTFDKSVREYRKRNPILFKKGFPY